MRETVSQLTTILRTRRFHEVTRLVQVYKSKIPPFVEYRTPAVYQAGSTVLAGIDAIQKRFLRECTLTEEDAILFVNLAPGNTLRDCNAGPDSPICSWMWPETLCEHFPISRHHRPVGTSSYTMVPVIYRSGSVRHWVSQISTICFQQGWFDQTSVAAIQHELQCLLKFSAVSREDGWQHTCSPRVSLAVHPLPPFRSISGLVRRWWWLIQPQVFAWIFVNLKSSSAGCSNLQRVKRENTTPTPLRPATSTPRLERLS